jgi:hypothetical protein
MDLTILTSTSFLPEAREMMAILTQTLRRHLERVLEMTRGEEVFLLLSPLLQPPLHSCSFESLVSHSPHIHTESCYLLPNSPSML